MTDEYAIELENVCKAFKIKRTKSKSQKVKPYSKQNKDKKIVLDNINLKIRKGETIGIIGKNGSGKSTMLKIISSILEPDSGTVKINGKVASILELGMGFHQEMSGRENIYIKGAMYGFNKKEIEKRIDEIIRYSGLEEQIDDPLRTYSSGMSGRLAFAIMVNVDADILIIDEILSVGDASFSAKASQHFRKASKSGKTILFASHAIGSVNDMCSRTIWIDDNKIREDGQTKKVCEHYQKEILESFEITKGFAESGVVDAQYRLAHMYIDGENTKVDIREARKWMSVAAENNNLNAMFEYGDMLFEGVGGIKDIPVAMALYQRAADFGNSDAAIKVAMHMDGDNDRQMLIDFFKNLAERGNPKDEYNYGNLLLKINTSESDRKTAFESLRKAADHGNLDAKYQLANMYKRGIGVKSSKEQYLILLEEVANLGHNRAQYDLAELFSSGLILEKNDEFSFHWHLKSAFFGNPKSQYKVAVMYRDGEGVEANVEEAKKWFKIFSNSSLLKYWMIMGDVLKTNNMGLELTPDMIYEKMAKSFNSQNMLKLGLSYKNQKTDECTEHAVEWLRMSADRQNIAAKVLMGDIFSDEKYPNRDYAIAFDYYFEAFVAGNLRALASLVKMHKNGTIPEQDLDRYEEYIDR